MDTHYRLKFPEEIELESKKSELDRLKAKHSAHQATLDKLKSELRLFEKVYDQVIGQRIAEMNNLESLLGSLNKGLTNLTDETDSSSEGEWSGHLHATNLLNENDDIPLDNERKSLKALYRELAKSIHPDLALSEGERARRQKLMAFANCAYAEGNRQALLDILKEWEHSPEKVRGKDIGAELVKVIRLISKECEEIHTVDAQINELKSTDTYLFKLRVDEAVAKGIDLLAEMAATVDLNIANARKRLSDLKGEPEPFAAQGSQLDNRIIRFPTDVPCGVLYVRKKSSLNYCDWQELCLAKGARTIPLGMAVRLDVRGDGSTDLEFLKELQFDDLQSLFMYEISDVTLGYIDHLTGLEEMYLSDSTVTDKGLWKLSALPDLKRIYLYHTDITDAGLIALYGLKKLSQFTCSGTQISDSGLERLQQVIPGIKTLNFPWRYGKK